VDVLTRGGRIVRLAALSALAVLPARAATGPARALIFCAPGFPGSTSQAAATMTSFADAVAKGAELPEGSLAAEYHEAEEAGVERLRREDVALALVTLPFYAKHRDDLLLTPRRVALPASGPAETFGLVARRGAIVSAGALAEYEIVGIPAYAPEFVRKTIFADFGDVPASARFRFTSRVNSSLIRAAEGDKIAVLVDGEQLAALPGHPRAANLEVVARSKPLPGSVVCEVGTKASAAARPLLESLDRLKRFEAGAAALRSIRLSGFEPIDAGRLDRDLRLPPRTAGAKKP